MEKLSLAITLATNAHDGQIDKAGFPYIAHPFRVMQSLHFQGYDEDMLVAAILHDTVEDTAMTLDIIETHFGQGVRNLVDAVTRRDSETTYTQFIDRVKLSGSRAIILKLADMDDNMDPRRPAIPSQAVKYQKARIQLLS